MCRVAGCPFAARSLRSRLLSQTFSVVPVTAAFLGRTENSTVYSNLIWDVTESFRVAFEVSWRETLYRSALVPDNDGVFFHTQFAWNF